MTMLMPEQQMMTLHIGRELPLLPIAADLMPPEIVDDRRDKRVRTLVIILVVVLTAVMGGWYSIARFQTGEAEENLANAKAEVQKRTDAQKEFAELTDTKNSSKQIEDQLKVLMADDLQWADLFAEIRSRVPAGVDISALNGGVAAGGVQQNSGGLPKTYTEKQIGFVRIAGTAKNKDQIAAFSDALESVKGLGNPMVNEVTGSTGAAVTFSITVDLTAAALGGRFTPPSAAPSPSK
ncbi:hypothetical protein Val02_77840 [Virgisporangium aliadipatigenens]|uniref:Uncharacterized protein n=1 Tax=Virgisporangium aliadipatigenens TaxID=741659 RepID=A0A8J3YUR9_9ACTN|nr:hypothetical protein [Virgisporangium aliadipatigenens]GIJ50898.1 hypothetical protein Val02_77840 [Virgisporangium aliadipatigenens]